MDEREERAARESLSIYEVLLAAHVRRQEVFDVICTSANEEEAERRLRALLSVPEGIPGTKPIIDMAMSKWTQESRDFIVNQAEHLRKRVSDSRPQPERY
jgi:DNA gyrase/topoisomerase IV subunit A